MTRLAEYPFPEEGSFVCECGKRVDGIHWNGGELGQDQCEKCGLYYWGEHKVTVLVKADKSMWAQWEEDDHA